MDSSTASIPQRLAVATLDDFRRSLVGIADHQPVDGYSVDQSIKRTAHDFVSMLADLYAAARSHDNGDYQKMWDHIAKGLGIARTAWTYGDFETFATSCLSALNLPGLEAAYSDDFMRLIDMSEYGERYVAKLVAYMTDTGSMQAVIGRAKKSREENRNIRSTAKKIMEENNNE